MTSEEMLEHVARAMADAVNAGQFVYRAMGQAAP
jgi:hypothetical protein